MISEKRPQQNDAEVSLENRCQNRKNHSRFLFLASIFLTAVTSVRKDREGREGQQGMPLRAQKLTVLAHALTFSGSYFTTTSHLRI